MNSMAILESYGWQKGNPFRKGAISKPLLTSRKTNLRGIGADEKHGNEWWNKLFDEGIKNIRKKGGAGEASLSVAVERAQAASRQHSGTLYRFFVKGEGLQGTIMDTTQESRRRRRKEERAQRRAQRAQIRQQRWQKTAAVGDSSSI